MKRYHEDRARIRSEHRFHLRYVHHWPKESVDCECELQAGRFRKKKARDCGKAACLLCHYEKFFRIASYQDRVRLLRAKDSMADYIEEFTESWTKSETKLERLAGWCLWITCWGPIMAMVMSLQKDVDYSFYVFYRRVVFPALLIQICLRLAQEKDPDFRKTALLVILAVLQNPIRMIHFGVMWPWWIVNALTLIVSFWAIAEVRDSRLAKNQATEKTDVFE